MKQTREGFTKQGVRDLNHLKRKESRKPKPKNYDVINSTIPRILTLPAEQDLIYDAAAYWDIKDSFPNANIEDDYSEIKGHRLVVTFYGIISLYTWYRWLIDSGWYNVSLGFQLSMYTEQEAIRYLLSELDKNETT